MLYNILGTIIVITILIAFTLVMWPYTLGVMALRSLKKKRHD